MVQSCGFPVENPAFMSMAVATSTATMQRKESAMSAITPIPQPESQQRKFIFNADPHASDHVCDNCKVRDAEMSYGFWSPEEEFDESGFCCTLCAMALVSERSDVKRKVKIETSDGRWCQLQMGPEDFHSAEFGSD